MELVEDLIQRLGDEAAGSVLESIWNRPILKRDALGIHGTLFYDNEHRRDHIPPSKREIDWDDGSINKAQRDLFETSVICPRCLAQAGIPAAAAGNT
ncbi:hypothetical protein [Rhizobium rhizogenes]|uniref:hypothetical protein n=1 Tax=Rhizobium rhizogenes TaxID=359 RepID=UPI000ADD7C71|nr:hypothetical protein [Rhizobium rhizogenes]